MSILWVGGEDSDFVGSATISTTAGHFRAGYARCAIGGASGSPIISPAITLGTSFYIAFRCRSVASTSNYRNVFGITDSSQQGIWLGIVGYTGNIQLVKGTVTATSAIATSAATPWTNGAFGLVVIQVVDYGANCTINIYYDGNLVLTYTGDLTVSGVTALDRIVIPLMDSAKYIHVSEVIIADEDPSALSLVTLAPNGAGTDNNWDEGDYDDIDDITKSDTTMLNTNTADLDFQANLTALPAGNFSVRAVVPSVRAVVSSNASIEGLKLGVMSGATIDVGDAQTLTTAWSNYQRIMTTIGASSIQASAIADLQLTLRSAE